MKKFLLLILVSAIYINGNASDSLLTKYTNRAKEICRQYVNSDMIKIHKSLKNTQSYSIGDSVSFWKWDLSGMPPQNILVSAKCRAVGAHSYVFVADDDWLTELTQDDVDTIMHYLEDVTLNSSSMGIVEMDETNFGPIPDALDNDPKVIFFYSSIAPFMGTVFDGYFSAYNQITDAEAMAYDQRSNECEMLYLNCDKNQVDPTGDAMLSVIAHELQHLIHFGIDPYEESWVDEGCAEYAMVLFGNPDPIVNFPQDPNNGLTTWDSEFSDYVQTQLFFTYLSEQFGGADFIKQIVSETTTGVQGIEDALVDMGYQINFDGIFLNWTIANFIDDNSLSSGEYGYETFELPQFNVEANLTGFPIDETDIMQAYACQYYDLPVDFETIDLEVLHDLGNWNLMLLAFDNDSLREVISSVWSDTVFLNQPVDYQLSRLVLCVTCNDLTEDDYEYFIFGNDVENAIININLNNNIRLSNYPNPFGNTLTVEVSNLKITEATIEVFNIEGQKIYTIFEGKLPIGKQKFEWNAENFQAGVYFVRLQSDDASIERKCILQK